MNKAAKGKIEISSTLDDVSKIEKFVDDYLQQIHISEDLYGKIFLATIEAANNAVTHGNKLDASKNVYLELEVKHDELIIDIKDMGDGFDYENLPDPTAPENIEKPDGRGIFIISQLSDKLEFNEKGNEMRITFNIV
ncbi:MAG: ATP-binding protein [Bacteroidales bacterium]|nr:ATP-binding protein [Bacteroidales bacterium]